MQQIRTRIRDRKTARRYGIYALVTLWFVALLVVFTPYTHGAQMFYLVPSLFIVFFGGIIGAVAAAFHGWDKINDWYKRLPEDDEQ
ncbi:hypothetical protein SEA_FORZA_43 [Gordonia phage Forza]|uniref:Uncharacterized protein n=1 Tax=Gordonia phage Forza TaxID=2571247 RepID=A0A650EY04_9CAUD|nr:hypothetical protein PP303_gp043 [Gordonia phage Forza]QEM41513.1 hypothetical protein SEA_BOOPY_44 [Gordonia phage Boopy]QGT55036.1 hypothetical protein SEA_FORZA_43 [Gordonia phage Forza]UXE04186.1 hypothetical protein SEA_BLUENGOLD_42 [Gordonia phage BlueNGold]WBF03825.1 hypothetical protein SEA_MAREELIH_42 [Gordonia phage Mareelih]